jgi:hypothetical protein
MHSFFGSDVVEEVLMACDVVMIVNFLNVYGPLAMQSEGRRAPDLD